MPCGYCSQAATLQCSNCKEIFYCCKEHQKLHWKIHKRECISFKVVTSEVLGRHMVAKRDIKPGEIILEERPLVFGPKMASFPICLGCDRLLNQDFYKCCNCGWPICNVNCIYLERHKKECQLMSPRGYYNNICPGDLKMESAYSCITPIRCLLLPKSDFDILMNLQSHLKERINTPLYQIHRTNLVLFIRNVLGLADFDEETILKVAAILDTNTFEIRRPKRNIKIRALYPKAAMMSHDCCPNTKHIFIGNEYILRIISTVKIIKGDIISLSYTQTLWGTLKRREHLWRMKHFWCSCKRCSDRSEYGTYLGSFSCKKCRNFVVSENSLDCNARWKCIKCNESYDNEIIFNLNSAITEELRNAAQESSISFSLKKFIEKKQSETTNCLNLYMHDKNHHIVEAKHALMQIHIRNVTALNNAKLEDLLNICKELLEIGNVLEPGLSTFRGELLFWIYVSRSLMVKKGLENRTMGTKLTQEWLQSLQEYRKESEQILNSEQENFERMLSELNISVIS